jgi:hypothetical protein
MVAVLRAVLLALLVATAFAATHRKAVREVLRGQAPDLPPLPRVTLEPPPAYNAAGGLGAGPAPARVCVSRGCRQATRRISCALSSIHCVCTCDFSDKEDLVAAQGVAAAFAASRTMRLKRVQQLIAEKRRVRERASARPVRLLTALRNRPWTSKTLGCQTLRMPSPR